MTKAALISTCGDVFITSLLLKLWKERWYDEIDHMYINFNNHCKVPNDVVSEFITGIASDPKITLIYHPTGIGNGPPQVENLKLCNEDLVLMLEDDFFIFEPGVVSGYFKKIEDGECDVLGSPRYTIGEVADVCKEKFNLDYSGIGDKGFGWWPTGFYCKKEDLFKTDLDFGSKHYPAGTYFKELDHTFVNNDYNDTFTWASVQLRALGVREIAIPQYHASPFEIDEFNRKDMKWADEIKYIHGGSLSAGWGGYLSGRLPDVSNESAKLEIETRCAFWTIAAQSTVGFEKFKTEYMKGIENLINSCNLDVNNINKKITIYKNLMRI